MKKALNVSKYSSNTCLYGELARFPMSHNAWALCVKHWIRLYNGTSNVLLNKCFQLSVSENHQWIQSMKFLLTSNGLADIWYDPPVTCGQSHRLFKNRLNDQFIQVWRNSIASSTRFVTRHILSNEYVVPKYKNEIRNPDIRLLFTRLRTDLNILATSRANKKRTELCPLCNNEPETVSHFITRCQVFVTERNNFYDNVIHVSPSLPNKCDNQQLKYILDLRCPPETNQCCKFVANLYARRERYSV